MKRMKRMKKVKIFESGDFEVTAYSNDTCSKCEKKGVPVLTINFSYHTIDICFECLETARKELEAH